MISQKSSANKNSASFDFKKSLKALIVPSIVSLLASLYYFVVLVYDSFHQLYDRTNPEAFVETVRKYVALGLTYTGYDPFLYSANITSMFICLTAIGIGVLFAFASYRFLMKKKCVNVYLSLGVDRRTLFKNRTAASMLLMAATSLVPIIIDIAMNIHFLGDPAYIISHGFYVFIEYYAYMLVGFSMMSVAMMICNNVLESLVFGAGFILSPTVLLGSLHMLFSVYLRGYGLTSFFTSGVDQGRSLLNHMSIFNPIFFGRPFGNYGLSVNVFSFTYRGIIQNNNSDALYGSYINFGKEVIPFEYMLPVIIWLAVCAVFILIARRIFLSRKAEKAGHYGASSFVNTFISIEVAFLMASAAMYVLGYCEFSVKLNGILNLIAGAFIFLVLYSLILCISKRKIRIGKKYVAPSVVTVCLMCVTVAVLSTGGFGYSTRVPDFDDVKYAAISSNAVDASGTQSYNSYEKYYNPDSNILISFYDAKFALFNEKEDLQRLADVQKALAEKTDNMTGSKVSVIYVLNDGTVMQRIYNDTDYDACYNVLSLTDTNAYRNELKYLMSSEEKNNNSGNLSKISDNNFDYDCFFSMNEDTAKYFFHNSDAKLVLPNKDLKNIENTDELKDALLADRFSMTYDQIYKSDEKPIATVLFIDDDWGKVIEGNYEDDEKYANANSNTISFNLYPSMSNTINYLKSTGEYALITGDNSLEKFGISSAKVMKCSDVMQNVSNNDYILGGYISYLFEGSVFGIAPDGKTVIEGCYNPVPSVFADAKEITDAQKINAVAEASTSFGYASPDDYIVYFENSGGSGYSALIRADKAPEFVK